MQITSVKVGPYTISVGDILISSAESELNGICPVGTEVVVKEIQPGNLIGIVSSFVIKNDIKYKNQDLKGEKCRVLKKFKMPGQGILVFVELDKYVSGGCADGLGKMGHCLLLSDKDVELRHEEVA